MPRPIDLGVWAAGVLAGCLLTPLAAGQDQGPAAPTFSARSDLVVLRVTVFDRRGRLVTGLARDAFAVLEDDEPQTVEMFSAEDSPITVGLVIDNSGSMHRKRDAVIAAGLAFARASHPDDEMFTVNFADHVTPGLPPGQPFTSDLDVLRAALGTARARGRTSLYDALGVAIRHASAGSATTRVLIVVSDGGDNASATALDEIVTLARQSDAVIYTIGLHDDLNRDARPEVLKQLARDTGGSAHFPKRVDDTTSILEAIAREIRSGYTLGYAPTNAALDGSYRELEVKVRAPGHDRLRVRARSGYLAPAAPSASP